MPETTYDTYNEPVVKRTLVFDRPTALRKAMKAARTIITNRTAGSITPTCRLVAAEAGKADVFASDGHRLLHTMIPGAARARTDDLDTALPVDAVRAIANWNGEQIELTHTNGVIRLSDQNGREAGPFDEPGGVETPTFRRILRDHDTHGGGRAAFRRRQALELLRAFKDHGTVRVTVGADGLKLWATMAKHVGPNYNPDAVLAPTGQGDRPGPLGLKVGYLTDCLRTMTAKTVRFAAGPGTEPVELTGEGTSERMLVALADLY